MAVRRLKEDMPWIKLANALLSELGLPPFLNSLSECQPFMLVSLLERTFKIKLSDDGNDYVGQLDDGLRYLAVEILRVSPSELNHITAARIQKNDRYSLTCLLEILARLAGMEAPAKHIRSTTIDPSMYSLSEEGDTTSSTSEHEFDDGIPQFLSEDAAMRGDVMQLNDILSSIDPLEASFDSDSDSEDNESVFDLDLSLRIRELVNKCRADATVENNDNDRSQSKSHTSSTSSENVPVILAPTPDLINKLNLSGNFTPSKYSENIDRLAQHVDGESAAVGDQAAGICTPTLSHIDSLDTPGPAYTELVKTPQNEDRRKALMREVLDRCQKRNQNNNDVADCDEETSLDSLMIPKHVRFQPPANSVNTAFQAPWPAMSAPDLGNLLPGAELDPHSVRWLKAKFGRQADIQTRNRIREATRKPRPGVLDDETLQQKQKLQLLKKDISVQKRLLRQKLSRQQERAVKAQLAEHRRGVAKLRRYYQEFHLAQAAKLKQNMDREELLLRDVFKNSLAEYREQVLSMKRYTKDQKEKYDKAQNDRMTSLSRWYNDQLALLEKEFVAAQLSSLNDDAAILREVNRIRHAFQSRLEKRVEEMQSSLVQEDSVSLMHRLRDIHLGRGK